MKATLLKLPLLAAGLTGLVGCAGMKPVGPLAKEVPIVQQGQPLPGAQGGPTASRPPSVKPTPPTLYVTPENVNPENANAIAAKLASELEADMKPAVSGPVGTPPFS